MDRTIIICCLCFLSCICLWSLYVGVTSAEILLFLLCRTLLKVSYLIIIMWISLEKGGYFDLNQSLQCVYPTLHIIRLLGKVYHFSLLIVIPVYFSSMFDAGSEGSLLLMTLGKIRNLP